MFELAPHVLRWSAGIGCAALLVVTAGCSELSDCDTSNDGNPPDPYEGGVAENGHFMSSPWSGPLLPFPGGKRYDIKHKLGCVPYDVQCFLSFSGEGTKDSSIAQSAGNLCVIQEITDEHIEIKNDTCSDMYVLVTALADCGSDAGAVDSGAEGGDGG